MGFTVLHHDDLDGVVSAALLAHHLRSYHNPVTRFIPVDYGHDDLQWDSNFPKGVDEPFAVVDFLFHGGASWWFDHHPTAFPSKAHEQMFNEGSYEHRWYWQPHVPSCAQVLANCLPNLSERFAPLIAGATLVDQAGYRSVMDYFEPTDPAVSISLGYPLLTTGQKSELVYQLLQGLPVARQFMADACDLAEQRNAGNLLRTRPYTHCEGHTAIVDLVGTDVPFTRFSAFAYHPEARYMLTLSNGDKRSEVRMSLSKNPWLEFEPVHLGALARTVGGGGHAYAAGATFAADEECSAHIAAVRFTRQVLGAIEAMP